MSTEQTAIHISNGTSYFGIGTTILGGLSLSEWGFIIGVFFWCLGWISTQYWSHRKDVRDKIELRQRMRYRSRAMRAMEAGKWATWQDQEDNLEHLND